MNPRGYADPAARGVPAALPAQAASVPAENPESGEKAQPVPEPNALLLVGTGLLGVALVSRLRRRTPKAAE